jgi:type I restriction enzyme S subunit
VSSGTSSPPKLPKGWVCTALGEVIEPSDEKIDPAKAQNMPYIGLEHIGKDSGKLVGCGYANDVRSTKTRFYAGDLLYGRLRPYLNKAHVIDCDGICSTDILVFPAGPYLSNKFLLYRILFGDFVSFASHNMSGVQHPRVSFRTLSRFPVFLPPLPEQHRIVAKIEELFTRLDAGVESLKKIKTQLKRYRQSVLKHAFEGKLTAEWRKAHQQELEPASVLLERIKQERQKTAKGKYKQLPPVDTSDLPQLPEGWVWTVVEDVSILVTKGSTPTSYNFDYVPRGINFIKVENLKNGRVDRASISEFITKDTHDFLKRSQLMKDDILFSIAGTIGKVAIVHSDDLPANINQAIAIIRCPWEFVNPDYIKIVCDSGIARQSIERRPRGVGMNNVSLGDVKNIVFPLPPLPEQHRIVEEVERHFSVADQIEKTVDHSLKQAERLRHSILKRAFEGKLILQDPNDKPAQKLLERIKAERTKHLAEAKAASKNMKTTHRKQMRLM